MKKIRRPRWMSDRFFYITFRILAVLAAALPPSVRAMQLFPVWQEARTIQVKAGLGLGAILALLILVIVFKDMVIGTLKKHMGLVRVLIVAAVWLLLIGLRVAAPYIPKLEEIAFWALIGGLVSWGFSAIAMIFVIRGGKQNGNDQP